MIYLASRAPDCLRHVASRARAVVARGGRRGARRDSGGRFARPHAHHVATARRVVALAVLALVLLVPNVANAEIAYDPLPNTIDGLVAPYRYDLMGRMSAAGEVIGRDFAWLTDEQQQFIIDYNGGDNYFVQFANRNIKNLGYEPSPNANALSAMFPFFISSFGRNEVWYFQADSESADNARIDYDLAWNAYLNGSGVGGGGSSAPEGYVDYFSLDTYSSNKQYSTTFSNTGTVYNINPFYDGSSYADPPSFPSMYSATVRVPSSFADQLSSLKDDGYTLYANLVGSGNRNGNFSLYIYAFKDGTFTWATTGTGEFVREYVNCVRGQTLYRRWEFYTSTSSQSLLSDDGIITLPSDANFPASDSTYNYVGGIPSSSANDLVGLGEIITDDPTYPTPPTPPKIPEPDPPETKPIDDPGIKLPPINFPDLVLPDIDYTVDTPTGTDVIPYLKKIIANQEDIAAFLSDALSVIDEDLDNIGEALGEHCNHLQQQLQKQVYWLATELQDMFDGLEVGISNYLYRVQTKLLQGIGWEFDNLSQDIISWLKRIYSRLGGNGISKPDPTTDPVGFWDWLIKQFSDFFEDLFGKSTTGLTSLFDSLKEFFPFSLPWDIVALLGLFVHEPVTPVFDLPLPVPPIVSDSRMYLIHVDCHPWDGTMQIVRALEFVFFAYHLMRMVPSWFNEIKVSGM